MMLIAAASDVDVRALRILRGVDDLEVAENAPQSVVVTEDAIFPVQLKLVEAGDVAGAISEGHRPGEPRLVVVNAVIDDETAAQLEDAGVSYVDAAGRRWLPNWNRTKRVREAAPGRRRKLYAPSVRMAQLLADHPDEPWTERGLALRGETTQATAHRLLARLEAERLLDREGSGPSTARRVRDPRAMRAWLAREGRPHRVTRLSCFLRDPFEPRDVFGVSLALTGAAAAAESGAPVLTRSVVPTMRVDVPPARLDDIPEALGGFRTESGPNLHLIADPGRLAFVDTSPGPGKVRLAPPSRILLDLYLEPRGEAAAEVFLDLWPSRRPRS